MRLYKELQDNIRSVKENLCLYLATALPTDSKQTTILRVLPTVCQLSLECRNFLTSTAAII
jgi:hypothetical protein